jgi:short-subunit dehydrogenase
MHVLITGASAGIGAALAREFARAGAQLTLAARRRDLLDALAAELGVKSHVAAVDLGDPDAAVAMLVAAEAALGPVDVLINNAGVQIIEAAAETEPARGRALLDLDLVTPLLLTRAVLPAMVARGAGTIVDVASAAGLAPTPGMWWYNAAKGGLAAASESLRGELRRTGVHVVTVYPGPVDTAMGRAGYLAYPPSPTVKLLPEGDAATLARLVRRAVERRRARVIYPWFYTLTRWFPTVSRWFLDIATPPPIPRAERKS